MFRVSRSSVSNLLLVMALCMGLLAATSLKVSAAPSAARQVLIEARDYSFTAPASIGAGYTSFTMVNRGSEMHHAQIARLTNGKTIDDLTKALSGGNPNAAFAILEFVGGPSIAMPGTRTPSVTLNLQAGSYVLMCFVESRDGKPHFAKGMLKPMQVVASGGSTSAPTAEDTVVLKDFSFQLPGTVKPGMHTWNIVNHGPQVHEMTLVKLNPGKTLADALQAGPSGPPAFRTMGGMQALNPGKSGWITANFQPGTYAVVCYVPDQRTGKPHAQLGMAAQFTVAGTGTSGSSPLPETGAGTQAPLMLFAAALGLVGLGIALRRRRYS